MEIQQWPLEKITPYARNARQIPTRAIDKVAGSIREFGWRQPIVVDPAGVVIAGHVRLLAAQKLELDEAPVHVARNLTPAQVRAYRLLDNRSHEETSWDEDLLGLELLDLKGLNFDLDLTGFELDEIDELIGGGPICGLTDPDSVPEVPNQAITATGDLWILGEHLLLCGDATDQASYATLLSGQLAHMVFTDPPYNVSYLAPGLKTTVTNDDLGTDFFPFLDKACMSMLRNTQGAFYICMSSSELHTLYRAFVGSGGHWSTFIIWGKNNFTLGRSDYQRQFEPILYGWRQGQQHYWCDSRNQGDLWLIDRPHVNDLHPTMKPVELVEKAIGNSCRKGEMVLDPFAGSGSTLIACERTGRKARLIEIEPRYCDVVISRWQEFTGKDAVHAVTGKTFCNAGIVS